MDKSAPTWLSAAQHVGRADRSAAVDFRVYLSPRGGLAAVRAAVLKSSTPGQAGYRKFVTPAQYHRTYDPTAATVASVRSWLSSNHLSVRSVGQYNAYVQVSGTVAHVQKAFGTHIDRYVRNGTVVQANATPLTTPVSVASSILSVTGIDTARSVKKVAATPPPDPAFLNGRPCSKYYGQLTASRQADYKTPLPKFGGKYLPYAVCGYTGPQLRSAYEKNSTASGTGVTVGIIDAYYSPTLPADANTYAVNNGDGAYAPGQFTKTLPSAFRYPSDCPDPAGWFGEQSLDVEAVHAMAPGAKIHYYGSASCEDPDFVTVLAKLVNDNKVDLVSNSYGEPDEAESTGLILANESLFLQAALQGISLMFSSGDNGDEVANTGLKQSDSSASDPYVTAVGGTSDAIDASGAFTFQTGWGTHKFSLSKTGKQWTPLGYLYGAGGGYSSLYNRPAYQNGVVPASAPAGRAVPDVAMDSDPTTGMLVGQTQTFPTGQHYGEYRIGGTSLGSPLFTGMTALLAEHVGGRLGFLNPTIYGQHKSGSFTDIKGRPGDRGNVRVDYANSLNPSGGLLYSVRTFDQDSSLTTTSGWDDVTGVGAPNARWITSIAPTG